MIKLQAILRAGIFFLAAFASVSSFAQSFTETFDTGICSPTPCAVTSFSKTLAGTQFDFVFETDGDGGDFAHNAGPNNINMLSGDINTATTERVTISRSDGQPFVFTSIDLDNGSSFAEDVLITGRLSGAAVESQVALAGTLATTYSFGGGSGIQVDEVELTSTSFETVFMDNFAGALSAATPDISINDLSITENNTTASFTVSLSTSTISTVTVDYATANGTAMSGSDYSATTGTLTFTSGETSKTVDVSILEDTLYENNETFFVNLSNSVNANIADSQGQGTISNDDPAPTVTLLPPGAASVSEGDGPMVLTAELSAASGLETTVNLSYSGTAIDGIDYNASSSITIPAGDLNAPTPITLVDDNLDEPDETVVADISSVSNGTEAGGFQQVTFTILDDDETPVVTAGQSFSVNENSTAGTSVGTVAATDGDAGTTFQNWTIVSNANPDGDGNNAFSIDSTTGELMVNDPGDLDYESNTSLNIQVTVSDGTNTSSAETVTININDVDDTAPTITVNTGITLDQGATETIDASELQATDADTDDGTLNFGVTAGPANGQLELTTGPGTPITSFTQAQIDAGQVVYVHDGSATSSDSFSFDVQDGSGNNLTGQTFSISIVLEYSVGGEVSGLAGSGLVLQNNGGDDLAIAGDGSFTFATPLLDGSAYEVTVFNQPDGPLQECTVSGGDGVISGANVTDVMVNCVTATWTVTFLDHDGTVLDTQTVEDSASATAPPDPTREGYSFAGWDVDFSSVTSDLEVTAQYEINTYTLSYTAGANGSIAGDSPQTVEHGADGTSVTAEPDDGYRFDSWSDGVTDNPRTDTNVQADLSVTAEFLGNTTGTTLASSLNPSIFGQQVTFTATVTPEHSESVSGTVDFARGADTLCADVALVEGQAECSTDSLPAGTHDLTAEYSGDADNLSSTSNLVQQQVELAIGPTALPELVAGESFSQAITASGGNAPYTFSVSGGELPPGLSLSPEGVLSGTATRPGDYSWTITASDGNGASGERGYSMGIVAPALPVPTLHPGLLLLLATLMAGIAVSRLKP